MAKKRELKEGPIALDDSRFLFLTTQKVTELDKPPKPKKPPRIKFKPEQVKLFKHLKARGFDVCWCFEDDWCDEDSAQDTHIYNTRQAEKKANELWTTKMPTLRINFG